MKKTTIGVLDLQGAVTEHIEALTKAAKKLRVKSKIISVRKKEDLARISGLVMPGGESTTINRLMKETGIGQEIVKRAKKGFPILATCAGTILLAKEGDKQTKKTNTHLLNLLEMKVSRNAYGRQVDSFEADIKIPALGEKPFRAVFIRAPVIKKTWSKTRVWAKYQNQIIAVKRGNILALTFHPELTDDLRIQEYFIKMIYAR